MKIFRMLPPALAPISLRDVATGMGGLFKGDRELERFREEIREFFQIKHCYLFSSGKAALAQTLKALHQLYPGRTEVLVPAFTCYSVPSAIVRAGLDIKLCDVNPESLDKFRELYLQTMERNKADDYYYFDEDYYSNSPSRDPIGLSHDGRRVHRGGSWNNSASTLRTSRRPPGLPPIMGYSFLGFRVVRSK